MKHETLIIFLLFHTGLKWLRNRSLNENLFNANYNQYCWIMGNWNLFYHRLLTNKKIESKIQIGDPFLLSILSHNPVWKWGFFSYVLGTAQSNFQQTNLIRHKLKQKFPLFTTIKVEICVRKFLPKPHFIENCRKLVYEVPRT